MMIGPSAVRRVDGRNRWVSTPAGTTPTGPPASGRSRSAIVPLSVTMVGAVASARRSVRAVAMVARRRSAARHPEDVERRAARSSSTRLATLSTHGVPTSRITAPMAGVPAMTTAASQSSTSAVRARRGR